MNILVTGCNGQLGNEMQVLSHEHDGHAYFFTDINVVPHSDGQRVFALLDITDKAAVESFVADNAIDCIVNCAAYTAVDKAEANEQLASVLNSAAPGFLAEAVDKQGGLMVQISTDYVFDGTAHTPYTEHQPTCPNSVYGRTKLSGEEAVLAACRKAVIIRTAWLYSIYGNNFVKTMIRLGREKEQLGVIFDQIGTPTYARDLARAIFAVIDGSADGNSAQSHSGSPIYGIYHFSNEGVCSWYDFTLAIHRLAGITTCNVKPLHTAEYPTPACRPHYSVLDKTKIKQTFGITIPHWEESLRDCVGLLRNND